MSNDELMIEIELGALDPSTLTERFKVRRIGARLYAVRNLCKRGAEQFVRFACARGRRLGRCSCKAFQFRRAVCKHMIAASTLHIALMLREKGLAAGVAQKESGERLQPPSPLNGRIRRARKRRDSRPSLTRTAFEMQRPFAPAQARGV